MPNYDFKCPRCGRQQAVHRPMARSGDPLYCELDESPMDRIYTAAFQFAYGREDFHGPTVRERVEEQLRLTPNAEPVGQRWV